jgi:hypothetical protein
MNDRYIFQKPPRRSRYDEFRRLLRRLVILAAVIGVAAGFIFANLHGSPKPAAQSSPAKNTVISDNSETYTTPFFNFRDTGGKWVLEKSRSTSDTFIYDKYQSNTLLGEIVFYVNHQVYMGNGFTRVLPVRLANDNSFELTGVSDPCVSQYGANEPHITKEIEFNGTRMYCNAGDSQYSVVVAEIGGDSNLNMKLKNGTPVQIEITYKFDGLQPDASSLLNIISSFQTT